MASREPVDAPEGTAARPMVPDSSNTSHSTVGLPRESRISRPTISTIALIGFFQVQKHTNKNGTRDHAHDHWKLFSSKAVFLVTESSATKVSSSAFMWRNGTALGPSDHASAGRGWVSMKSPATPAATPARASTGTISRAPPLLPPRPPGFCTEWVTSNTTGATDLRISARLVMSATRLL